MISVQENAKWKETRVWFGIACSPSFGGRTFVVAEVDQKKEEEDLLQSAEKRRGTDLVTEHKRKSHCWSRGVNLAKFSLWSVWNLDLAKLAGLGLKLKVKL